MIDRLLPLLQTYIIIVNGACHSKEEIKEGLLKFLENVNTGYIIL